jgi:hypothetical protein
MALILIVLSLVARPQRVSAVDRAVMPGFVDPSRITSIELVAGDVRTSIKRVGNEWRFADSNAVVDPMALDALFTALRAGRWHRRASATDKLLGKRQGITLAGTTFTLGVDLPGSGQRWIVRGDDALLVDSWIANALVPDPFQLRVRHPLDCNAPTLTATTSAGTLRIVDGHMIEPKSQWIDRAMLDYLADLCARLEIVSADGKRDGRRGLHVAAAGELRETGACSGDYVYVETSTGPGCIEARHVRELAELLAGVAAASAEAGDGRPLPIVPATLTLQDGSVLELDKRWRIAGNDADADSVRELLAALTMRGTVAARPAGKPRATITAVDAAGTSVTLELFDKVVARAGEPGAIALPDAAWSTITRPTAVLRDATRWREDVTTLTSITLDGVTYTRGVVLGEWTREPAGGFDPKLVDALAESLATVRAPIAKAPTSIAHRVRVVFTPPAGSPITHALDIGAPSSTHCAARIGDTGVRLPEALCMAVLALVAHK